MWGGGRIDGSPGPRPDRGFPARIFSAVIARVPCEAALRAPSSILPTLVASLSILGLPPVAAHAAKVDVVVLQNGSRIVGEVKVMRRARLELATDDMGTIQIEWGNVTLVTAPEFFEVEDMQGRLHLARCARARPRECSRW